MLGSASVAFTDMELRPTRHAGRGGVGAVMGSKGVKVIVLDDTGMKMRSPNDPEKFKEANKLFVNGLKKLNFIGGLLIEQPNSKREKKFLILKKVR